MSCLSDTKVKRNDVQDDRSSLSLPLYLAGEGSKVELLMNSSKTSSSGDSTEVATNVAATNYSCDSRQSQSAQGQIASSTRNTSPYSNASAVKPRVIPFGGGSMPESEATVVSDKERDRSNPSSSLDLKEIESAEKTPVGSANEITLISAKSTLKRSHVQPKQMGVPSVVEESQDPLNISAVSWAEEPFKVGNFNMAKHTDPNNVILYQVISKEEAGALLEGKGTFDTESPILSPSNSDLMETESGESERRFAESRLSWKIKAVLCVAGIMAVVAGLFVGIAVALINIDELAGLTAGISSKNISGEAIPSPTAPPTLSPIQQEPSFPAQHSGSDSARMPSDMSTTVAPTALWKATKAPTSKPSALAPVSLYDTLELPVHTWEAMVNSSSHHSRAFKFLQQDPNLAYYSVQRKRQRFVLAVLFHSTGGKRWLRNDSWLAYDVHECDWLSISCGQEEEVLNITLQGNGLGGQIPPEVALISTLLHLDLSDNILSGGIPSYLGDLTSLQTLLLHSNLLSATLPREFGNLTSLQELNLTSNALTGTIPLEWMSLAKLSRLGLAANRLTGDLAPEVQFWEHLTKLNLHTNRFQGSLPVQICKLVHLRELRLYDNEFTGILPTEIAKLEHLRVFELDENRLQRSIPTELGLLTNLKRLWLSSNHFNGSIPSELGRLTNLEGLYMQVNQLSGLLPSELGNLRRLGELRLFENSLRAKIPSELGRLSSLEQLSLGWNAFSGFIFSEVGNMKKLVELDLVSNNLDGSIPSVLGSLSRLKHLWLVRLGSWLTSAMSADADDLLPPLLFSVFKQFRRDNSY